MAKSTNGGTTKSTTADAKARRAPARRKADRNAAETPVAVAAEVGRAQRVATGVAGPLETAGLNPEEVRRRAYELYMSRGGANGSDVDDWLEAERQLRSRTH